MNIPNIPKINIVGLDSQQASDAEAHPLLQQNSDQASQVPKETPKLMCDTQQAETELSPETLKKKKAFIMTGNTLMPPILEEREMGSSELSFSDNPKNTITMLAISEDKSKSIEKSSSNPFDANSMPFEKKEVADIMIKEEIAIEPEVKIESQ